MSCPEYELSGIWVVRYASYPGTSNSGMNCLGTDCLRAMKRKCNVHVKVSLGPDMLVYFVVTYQQVFVEMYINYVDFDWKHKRAQGQSKFIWNYYGSENKYFNYYRKKWIVVFKGLAHTILNIPSCHSIVHNNEGLMMINLTSFITYESTIHLIRQIRWSNLDVLIVK